MPADYYLVFWGGYFFDINPFLLCCDEGALPHEAGKLQIKKKLTL